MSQDQLHVSSRFTAGIIVLAGLMTGPVPAASAQADLASVAGFLTAS
jgi:hypothetical protein